MSLDARTRTEVIVSLAKALRAAYVFPDVGEAVAKLLEDRNVRGEYNSITSAKALSDILTQQMFEAAHDKHLGLAYSAGILPPLPVSKAGEPPPSPDPAAESRQARANNYGFEKVERLGGNVGYLKFNAFVDAEGGNAVAAGAMAFVGNTDALILDLRENGGGGPSMFALLASYFFKEPVHLSDLVWRIAGTTDYAVTQTWTVPPATAQPYIDKQVYILTSQRTFSVAEAFTDALQTQKRAVVVGETTGGGANAGGAYRIGDHFFAALPMGHLDNPVTKTNWEGKGVVPDISVPEKDALLAAQRLALQRLIEKTTSQQALTALKRALAALDTNR
jgi:C-terminal processing protease CtpA/Prc